MAVSVTVKDGDTLLSIAAKAGFSDWKFIWDQNPALKAKRKDPNQLVPGDVVQVPDPRLKEVQKPTNQVHKFGLKSFFSLVDIVLRNEYGYVLKSVDFELKFGERVIEGKTDGNGRLCVALPPETKEAFLTVRPIPTDPEISFSWPIGIGHLNPILDKNDRPTNDIAGIQSRLVNLGFDLGVTGALDEKTVKAVQGFQRYVGHSEPTGILDDETLHLLDTMHNSL